MGEDVNGTLFYVGSLATFLYFLFVETPTFNESSLSSEAEKTYGLELIEKTDSENMNNEYLFKDSETGEKKICKVEPEVELESGRLREVVIDKNSRQETVEAALICGDEPQKIN